MKKTLFIGIILLMTAMFYGCVKDLHNSGISEATLLKGRVLEESEREPLVNVRVTVTNGTTDYTSTKTNNEGWFELTVNYNNFDGGNYLFLDAGSSGITKKVDLKGMGQESYNYGDIFLYNKNDGATPTITTSAIRDITSNGAICGGNITSDGGFEVTRRGLCWGVSEKPTISNSNVSCGSGTGEFTGAITGLSPNTKYHVRAFAINAIGPSYGEDREFETANGGGHITKPTVSTKAISTISTNSAECGGDVTSDGGSIVTERGLCWAKASTTHTPTISNYFVKDDGVGTGSFSCTMTNLTANTDYYVCAYAKNAVDFAYGDPVPFTTLSSGGSNSAPTVITGSFNVTSSTTATCYGDITSDGGSEIINRGICWSTSPKPTIPSAPWGQIPEPNGTEWEYEGGHTTGTFHWDLTNLSPNTKYYFRAFAMNQVDTAYGEDNWFTTLANNTNPPDVLTWSVEYNSSNNTATCQGMITSEGGAPVTACGVCWGTDTGVTIWNTTNIVSGNVPGTMPGMFTCTIPSSGLSPNTTYHVKAFATNRYGTVHGDPKPFATLGGGGGGGSGQTFSYTFESGAENWHQIDADGDGYTWMLWTNEEENAGHNNSKYLATSESYNDAGALFPDNYLYSPNRYVISEGAEIVFYVCAQDAEWPAEHYGVAVATVAGNPSASDFVTIWSETLSAKVKTEGKVRGVSEQGTWYKKTVPLNNYAGQTIWVAIRHFSCTDQFRLNVDDITIKTGY